MKLGHDVVVVVVDDEKKGGKREGEKERGEEPIVRLRTGLAKRRGRGKGERVIDSSVSGSEAPFAEKPPPN